MWLSVIVKMVTSDMAKALIAMLIKKLLDSKTDGITKDLALVLIDGVAKSKSNPTSSDMFVEASKLLK